MMRGKLSALHAARAGYSRQRVILFCDLSVMFRPLWFAFEPPMPKHGSHPVRGLGVGAGWPRQPFGNRAGAVVDLSRDWSFQPAIARRCADKPFDFDLIAFIAHRHFAFAR